MSFRSVVFTKRHSSI